MVLRLFADTPSVALRTRPGLRRRRKAAARPPRSKGFTLNLPVLAGGTSEELGIVFAKEFLEGGGSAFFQGVDSLD
jgi:hypothetical protein